jgi:SPP1 family predicted phage head-tail adaptor
MSDGAGRYRTPATIQRVRASAPKGRDGKIDLSDDTNWQAYCSRRVEERQIGGREQMFAQQVLADVTGLYRLRADTTTAGITSKMRMRICGRTLNIVRALRIGRPVREIELQCMEVTA